MKTITKPAVRRSVMPRTINVTLSDEDFEAAKEVKDERGLTWEGFVKSAVRCLEEE